MHRLAVPGALTLVVVSSFAALSHRSSRPAVAVPPPAAVSRPSTGVQTIVLAGGCFWGIEAVYEHVKGVKDAVSGYAGGTKAQADYETVSTGRSGHAEAVRVTFDPAQVSLEMLLQVFFSIAHDPTQLNRQGPDVGPQYRSAIFFAEEEQAKASRAYIEQLTKANVYKRPIVTQVVKLDAFYLAEDYHQDFAEKNPTYPYIVYHDKPKVENLKTRFPQLYRD